jgi:signal transduction histidine kinase/ligand-binding sensor domain-containing protein
MLSAQKNYVSVFRCNIFLYGIFLFALWFCLRGSVLRAEGMVFSRYSSTDEFSFRNVYAITQDRYGFIWTGTERGLLRFDGYDFLACGKLSSPDSLFSHTPVECLTAGSDGKLLMGMRTGLFSVDPGSGTIVVIDYLPAGNTDIYARWVQTIRVDERGWTWVGTRAGLFVLDKNKRRIHTFFSESVKPAGTAGKIQTVAVDSKGNVWIGADHGIALYNPQTRIIREYRPPDIPSEKTYYVNAILEVGTDSLFLSTSRGLELYTPSHGSFQILFHYPQAVFPRSALVLDNDHRIWMASDEGLIVYGIKTGSSTVAGNIPDDPLSLGSDHVRAVYRDRSGNLWIGTEGGGLNKLLPSKLNLSPRLFLKEMGFSGEVTCFLEDSAKSLWIGTNYGLFLRDGKHHIALASILPAASALHDTRILSLGEDGNECIWFGTANGSVHCINSKRNNFEDWRQGSALAESLYAIPVNAILRDQFNKLWFGTDRGLFLHNPGTAEWKLYRRKPTEAISLGDDCINGLFEDSIGNVWMANRHRGLSRFDRNLNYFVHYQHNPLSPTTISSNTVFQVLEDSRGRIWAVTADGANWLKQKSEYFVHIENMPGKRITGIAEDDSGGIWLNPGTELVRVHPDSRTFPRYDLRQEGCDSEYISVIYRCRDGSILLGAADGYYILNPSGEKKDVTVFPPLISCVESGEIRKTYPRDWNNSPVSIPEKNGSIVFSFSSPDCFDVKSIRYSYRLNGYDKDWTETSWDRRKAEYRNLRPGRYTFSVKMSVNGAAWNENTADVPVRIKPLFIHTWLFRGLLSLSFFSVFILYIITRVRARNAERSRLLSILEHLPGLVFLVEKNGTVSFMNHTVRECLDTIDPKSLPHSIKGENILPEWSPGNSRVYQLSEHPFGSGKMRESVLYLALDITDRKKMEHAVSQSREQYRKLTGYLQERIESERQNISREIHDELGQILSMIKMESGWISMLLPQGLEQIEEKNRSIDNLVMNAIKNMRKICEELRPPMLDTLGLQAAIQSHVQQFEKWTHIRCNLQLPEENLKGIHPGISIAIFRIIQECLTNIARHSKATEAWIILALNDTAISLTVTDNGIGMNNREMETKKTFGILGMRERVLALGGEIDIGGEPGKGTTITLTLPLKA